MHDVCARVRVRRVFVRTRALVGHTKINLPFCEIVLFTVRKKKVPPLLQTERLGSGAVAPVALLRLAATVNAGSLASQLGRRGLSSRNPRRPWRPLAALPAAAAPDRWRKLGTSL